MSDFIQLARTLQKPDGAYGLWDEKLGIITYSFLDAAFGYPAYYTHDIPLTDDFSDSFINRFTSYQSMLPDQRAAIHLILDDAATLSAPYSFSAYRVSYTDVVSRFQFSEVPHTDGSLAGSGDITFGLANITSSAAGLTATVNDARDQEGLTAEKLDKAGLVFDPSVLADPLSLSTGSALYNTFMHEIGHAMGLDDTGNVPGITGTFFDSYKYSIMAPSAAWAPGFANAHPYTLQLLDIAALQDKWQSRNYDTRSTGTTYLFNPDIGQLQTGHSLDTPFLYTIWDGGGIDLIDASSYNSSSIARPAQIDLRQGTFSSIGAIFNRDTVPFDSERTTDDPDPGNVAIAYYTVIENATGTKFNDWLIGNAWNNVLDGGAGDDRIYGDGAVYDTDVGFLGDVDPLRPAGTPWVHSAADGSGADTLMGGAGDDFMDGGAGIDTVSHAKDAGAAIIDLGTGTATDGWGDTDTLLNIENAAGSGYDDVLTGDAGTNILAGGRGSDLFYASSGNDIYYGEDVVLSIFGDPTSGGTRGSSDNDTLDFRGLGSAVTITTATGGYSTAAGASGFFSGIENVLLDNTNDTVSSLFQSTNVEFPHTRIDMGGGTDTVRIVSASNVELSDGKLFTDRGLEITGFEVIELNRSAGGAQYDFSVQVKELGHAYIIASSIESWLDYSAYAGALYVTETMVSGARSLSIADGALSDAVTGGTATRNIFLIGSNNGDTFDMLGLSGSWNNMGQLWTGTGDDTLSGRVGTYRYSGGDDVILAGGAAAEIVLGPTVRVGDVHIVDENVRNLTLSGSNATFTYDLKIVVDGFGTITLENRAKTVNVGADGILHTADDTVSATALGQTLRLFDGTSLDTRLQGEPAVFFAGTGNFNAPTPYDDVLTAAGSTTMRGGSGNDTITGDGVANTLRGDAGNDTIFGNGGGDNIEGGFGNDIIDAGAGSDQIHGGFGADTLRGGSGNDLIYGEADNDIIFGDDGTDTIVGGDGDDEIDGGLGDDTLYGNQGADLFIVAQGSGNEIVMDYNKEEGDVVRFTDPLADKGNLVSTRYGDALILTLGSDSATLQGFYDNFSGEQKDLSAEFGGSGSGRETLSFNAAGGLILTNPNVPTEGDDILTGTVNADIINALGGNDTVYGLAGDDQIDGGSGNDMLIGGADADTLTGGLGDDTYEFSPGDGAELSGVDTVIENTDEGIDRIVLHGVLPEDVRMWVGAANSDLYIQYTADDQILVYGDYSSPGGVDVGGRVEQITFDNGTIWDLTQGLSLTDTNEDHYIVGSERADTIDGQGGNDQIYADLGNDILIGGMGTDSLIGSPGDDTYVFSPGDSPDLYFDSAFIARDTVNEEIREGVDRIVLHDVLPDDVQMWADLTGYLRIQYTADDQIFVRAYWNFITGTDVGYRVEQIVFDNGAVWDLTQGLSLADTGDSHEIVGTALADVIDGSGGDDTIYAYGGNDTLIGGIGNDSLFGDLGDDTYKFSMGDGQDIISDADGVNKIVFDSSVTPADVSYARSGDDLVISYGTGGDQITVQNFHLLGQPVVFATVEFSDNSTFDLTSLLNTPPDAKDDTIAAAYGQPVTGNVLADNGSGADSDIDSDGLSVVETTVNTAAGFVVSLSTDGDFTYTPSPDFFGGDSFSYTVSDGREGTDTATVFLNIAPPAGAIIGTSGADTLTGTAFGEYILGLGGNDIINAGEGDDTLYGASGSDTLYGGKGNDTYFVEDAGDVVVEAPNKGTDLVMSSIDYTLGSNVENLTLTGTDNLDGTGNGLKNTLTGNSGDNTLSGNGGRDAIYGGDGNDTLFGDDGKDILYGQDGFDALWGGNGADTFVFEGATALNNVDVIRDFSVSQGDAIDISDVISAYDPLTDALTDFFMIEDIGSDSALKVDIDGAGGTSVWTQIATLEGVTGLTDEAALVASGHLMAA